MVRYFRHTEPQNLSTIHTKLSEYFQLQQTVLNLSSKEAYENHSWQKLELERVYHSTASEPEKNLFEITNSFLLALRWHPQFCEQIAELCILIGNESQLKKAISHGQELQNIHKSFQHNEHTELIQKLSIISRQKRLTSVAKSICYARLGRAKRILGNYEDAIKNYKKAIELDPTFGGSYSGLGETYRLIENFDLAFKNFDKGLELDPGDAWVFRCRALAFRALARYEDALNDIHSMIRLLLDLKP